MYRHLRSPSKAAKETNRGEKNRSESGQAIQVVQPQTDRQTERDNTSDFKPYSKRVVRQAMMMTGAMAPVKSVELSYLLLSLPYP